ncbi:MAG: type 4a pilus biogenesis protein PilO, partial [Microcella sp.]
MNLTRLWGVVSALLVLVILAGGWFLGVSPQLNRAATANEQLVQVQSGNELQRLTLAGLQQLEEQRPELEAQLADGRQAIPALAQFPPLLQELSDLAGASGVTLSNFSAQPAQSFVPAEQYAEIVPAGLDPATFIT